MAQQSDLPFGSEFSPSQIDLPELLEIVKENEGDVKAIEAAILSRFFAGHGKSIDAGMTSKNRKTLAMNCRLGLKAYKIIDDDAKFTDFGRELHSKRSDESELYTLLARHILLNLPGMTLVQCIQDMTAAGEVVDLTSLREGLEARGVHFPRGGKHPSIMRLWLVKAGVFSGTRWLIDNTRLKAVLGTNPDDFGILADLTNEQRAFLQALINTGTHTPQPANEIARLAFATYGVKFPDKNLPKAVLNALVDAGYITATKTTKGRGSKPFLVAPTEKLVTEIVEPLLEQLKRQTDPKLYALLRRPFGDIIKALVSKNKHVAGLALEALAFKLMRLLDVTYIATRLRASSTGGADPHVEEQRDCDRYHRRSGIGSPTLCKQSHD